MQIEAVEGSFNCLIDFIDDVAFISHQYWSVGQSPCVRPVLCREAEGTAVCDSSVPDGIDHLFTLQQQICHIHHDPANSRW
jgi:hypothetical protein